MLNKENILGLAWEHSEGSGERYTFTEESLFAFLKELKKEPAPEQDEWEAFEAWYERTFGARAFARNVDHSYQEPETEMLWAGWQARADRAAQTEQSGHPMQPIEFDTRGTIRFRENKIIRHLLDFATPLGCGLNELARMDFSQEDRMQLAQLIGYSVSGYGDLSYASDESVEVADRIAATLLAEQTIKI